MSVPNLALADPGSLREGSEGAGGPNSRNLRLPRDLAARLKSEALRLGISENAYIILAAREKLEAEEKRRQEQRLAEAMVAPQRGSKEKREPRGLGLGAPPPPPPAPPAEHQGPLVVVQQAGGAPTPSGSALPQGNLDILTGLLESIRKAVPWEKQRLARQAQTIIETALPDGPARSEALARVKAASEERRNEPRFGPSGSGSIGRLFR